MKLITILTFLGTNIVCVICAGSEAKYSRDVTMNGYDCNTNHYAFSSYLVRSKFECTLHCEGDSDCRSFFFYVSETGTGMCNGCTVKYNSTNISTLGLNILSGSVFYAAPFDYDSFTFTWQNSGYIITERGQPFTKGTVLCNQLGGFPIIIETQAEDDFVRNATAAMDPFYYIGLYRPDGAGTDWVWQGNGQVMDYNVFDPSDFNSDSHHCVYISNWYMFTWKQAVCSWNMKIICEISL